MAKVEKMVNSIVQIIPLNRKLNSVYEVEGRTFKRIVVCMALVNYTDGTTGVELMDLGPKLKVDLLSKGVIKLENIETVHFTDEDENKTMCICENNINYGSSSCTARTRAWKCFHCGAAQKIADCGMNHMLYDCSFCGEHLT